MDYRRKVPFNGAVGHSAELSLSLEQVTRHLKDESSANNTAVGGCEVETETARYEARALRGAAERGETARADSVGELKNARH